MKYQHVTLSIELSGNEKVAFVTDFGWADRLSIELDMRNLEEAKKTAADFVKAVKFAPAFNDAGNEDYVNEATDEAVPILLDLIKEIKAEKYKDTVLGVYPFDISIKVEETYVVEFG